jgi:hypothetical protein
MDNEIWKPVGGWAKLYEVSNMGRFRSLDRTVIASNGKKMTFKGRVLKCHYDSGGHPQARMHYAEEYKVIGMGRLVLETFLKHCPPNLLVGHHNLDKGDCRLVNLYLQDHSQKNLSKYESGHMPCGESHSNAKLTDAQVYALRKLKGRLTLSEFGELLGVCHATIFDVQANLTWKHLP